MREIDLNRVRDLVGQIQTARQQMAQLALLSEDTFLEDFRNRESAKYLLVVATEAAIDICNHIVARRGGRAPQDYAECFTILVELGIITPDLAARLRQMGRFRNMLVHLYWQIDNRRVYKLLQEDVKDLDVFVEQILASLRP